MKEIDVISCVIPCYNEEKNIQRCLESILAQIKAIGQGEVLVIDGMSTDNTRIILERMAKEHRELRILNNEKRLTPCAMNIGIRNAVGTYIAIMGAHSIYSANYLDECLKTSIKTKADNVGGYMRCIGRSYVQKAIACCHHSMLVTGGAKWHSEQLEGESETTFGGFYRSEVFSNIGLFDESLKRNQDDELNLRLRKAGGKIYQSAKIVSYYIPRGSILRLIRQYYEYGFYKPKVVLKHKRDSSIRHIVPGIFVFMLIGSLVLSTVSHFAEAVFLGLAAIYSLYVILVAIICSLDIGIRYFPVFPVIIMSYQLPYGAGEMHGLINIAAESIYSAWCKMHE